MFDACTGTVDPRSIAVRSAASESSSRSRGRLEVAAAAETFTVATGSVHGSATCTPRESKPPSPLPIVAGARGECARPCLPPRLLRRGALESV